MLNSNKNIKDADDFESYCCEALDYLCECIMDKPEFTREVNEDDVVDENISFMYRPRAVRLIEDFKSRLYRIAEYYGYDVNIYSHFYQET